jgi:hypothetical protein
MMRLSLSTMILTLTATSLWLGGPAASAEAASPVAYQYPENNTGPAQGQGQYPGMGQGSGTGQYAGQEQPSELSSILGLCDPDDCGPRWIVTAGAVGLQRSTTRSQTLLVDANGGELLNSQNLNFSGALGAEISGVRRGPCGWELEVAYTQVDSFTASTTVPGTSFIVYQSGDPDSVEVRNINVRYNSALYSGEVLLRRQWLDWLNLSAGFRMIELDERYNAGSLDAGPIDTPFSRALAINTFNHLYGFQLGADAEVYNMGGPLQVNVICKGGVYGNAASQNIALFRPLAAERNSAAFFGEAGIVSSYAITSHVAFRSKLGAAWLSGVALAPEQIATTDFTQGTTDVDTQGNIFYYGGSLGLEVRF